MASLEGNTQAFASHDQTHTVPQADMGLNMLRIAFFAIFFFVCAICILDATYPEAFSDPPSEYEQRILEESQPEPVKKGERTPLLRRERPADEEEGLRPPPFWPQARLSPWSVRYYDPDGVEMYPDDWDNLVAIPGL